MILKRVLIILAIFTVGISISLGLIILGNKDELQNKNDVEIYMYSEEIEENNIVEAKVEDPVVENNLVENVENSVQENENTIQNVDNDISNNQVINDVPQNNVVNQEVKEQPKQEVVRNVEVQTVQNNVEVKQVETKSAEIQQEQNTTQSVENKVEEVKNEEPKQEEFFNNKAEVEELMKNDVYTFQRNDAEIQNMINIAKRIIKENKDHKCDGLVNQVDSINFKIEKLGNVFYPLFDWRIEYLVTDTFFPQFSVYAEDIYKNGEFLRTEYYFN